MRYVRCLLGLIFVFSFSISGCGGLSGGGTNGGPNGTQTGTSEFLVGTCVEKNSDGEVEFCKETWTENPGIPGWESQARKEGKDDCNFDANNEWTSGEDVCPTGGGYIGTCQSESQDGKTRLEQYFYKPEHSASNQKSSCESGGQTWVVE